MRPDPKAALRFAGLFLLYVLAGQFGRLLHPVAGVANVVWPATGVSLAWLLVYGVRFWPAVTLGALLVNLGRGLDPAVAGAIAVGNTVETVVAVLLLRRCGFHAKLNRLRDVVALVGIGTGATALGAAVEVLALVAAGLVAPGALAYTWDAWWGGDVTSNLVIAPLLLTWASHSTGERSHPGWEKAALVALAVVLTFFVFGEWGPPLAGRYRFTYVLFPLVVWAGLRFGPRGASSTCFGICVSAVSHTAGGVGPFAGPSPDEGLLALQAFLVVLGVTTLVVGAVVAEGAQERRLARELRRANAALKRREVELTEAQDLAELGSFERRLDREEVRWSEQLCRIFGISPAEAPRTFEEFVARVHPADRARVRETVSRALRTLGRYQFEVRIVRADGAVRHLQARGRVQPDANGRPVRLLGAALDVTEQKHAEEARARLAAIVESADDAIMGGTVDGVVTEWNQGAERLFGYKAEDVLGKNGLDLAPPDRKLEVQSLLAMLATGEHLEAYESQGMRRDGTRFDVSVTLSPIRDASGKVASVSCIVRDVTALRDAERKATAALKQKELLLKELHHRVKNNLQLISSMLSLQAARVEGEEAKRGFEDSQHRLHSIALAHEQLYGSEDLTHVTADDYLGRVVRQLETAGSAASAGVRVEVRAAHVELDIDTAVPCGLIVTELVSNALKHAFPGERTGRVVVSLEETAPQRFALRVADDGVGLPPDVDFEHGPTIGLQIVGALAGQLGGSIAVDRSHGTAVEIDFTTKPKVRRARAPEPEPTPSPTLH